jgi:glycosyltransferase involved in cell wall biosynthesis
MPVADGETVLAVLRASRRVGLARSEATSASEFVMNPAGLRICVDARVVSGQCGGTEQVVIGLAAGFSKLTDGDEQYLFLTYSGADEWLLPYVQGPCGLLHGERLRRRQHMKRWLGYKLPALRDAWHRLRWRVGTRSINLPRTDGTIEKAGVEVMHFTTQNGFLTRVPSIYQPHDLQHLHLPQFFSSRDHLFRETTYRVFCAQAQIVAVMTSWGKRDLIQRYMLAEDKVKVVPWAPVLAVYQPALLNDYSLVQAKFHLPETFIFYPAQTWPHKNHIRLLESLAILRSRYGVAVPLVCSGQTNGHFPEIWRRARGLGLTDQVRFLGFVSPVEIQCLYKLCRCMVFPSTFEGCGMPILEAFFAGVPVACSNIGPIEEQAEGAALLFDPDSAEDIAESTARLWFDVDLRKRLVEHGRKKIGFTSWERTAKIFRAHYRRMGRRPLSDEDHDLLRASQSEKPISRRSDEDRSTINSYGTELPK